MYVKLWPLKNHTFESETHIKSLRHSTIVNRPNAAVCLYVFHWHIAMHRKSVIKLRSNLMILLSITTNIFFLSKCGFALIFSWTIEETIAFWQKKNFFAQKTLIYFNCFVHAPIDGATKRTKFIWGSLTFFLHFYRFFSNAAILLLIYKYGD